MSKTCSKHCGEEKNISGLGGEALKKKKTLRWDWKFGLDQSAS
jgi:hypothetical protein